MSHASGNASRCPIQKSENLATVEAMGIPRALHRSAYYPLAYAALRALFLEGRSSILSTHFHNCSCSGSARTLRIRGVVWEELGNGRTPFKNASQVQNISMHDKHRTLHWGHPHFKNKPIAFLKNLNSYESKYLASKTSSV